MIYLHIHFQPVDRTNMVLPTHIRLANFNHFHIQILIFHVTMTAMKIAKSGSQGSVACRVLIRRQLSSIASATLIPTVLVAACAMLTVTKTADYGKQANAVCRVLILRRLSLTIFAMVTPIPTVSEAACATLTVTKTAECGLRASVARHAQHSKRSTLISFAARVLSRIPSICMILFRGSA